MPGVRAINQSCNRDFSDEEKQRMLTLDQAGREREPEFVQTEHFRGLDYPENVVRVGHWSSLNGFDIHTAYARSVGSPGRPRPGALAPERYGTVDNPRRYGKNGGEFYQHKQYELVDNTWRPVDKAGRIDTIRWATNKPVRVIIQHTHDPSAGDAGIVDYAVETRKEPGCVQFEYFRSIEFPENLLVLELWESPDAFDRHWVSRMVQRMEKGAPSIRKPVPRRYGEDTVEFYPQTVYHLVEGVWMAEQPAERTMSIFW